ncbi:MAG: FAD-dependent oxidoreductase, partial [Actinomycetota bacterium]|nr:FAD-dependent oxidoreductase [Actinomycetota bacterium]
GAQFFTTRSAEFASLVELAVAAGVVVEWNDGFDDPPDGYSRWRGTEAMTDLVEWMAADAGLDLELGLEVTDLRSLSSRSHLLTAPVPQSLAVLSFSRLLPPPQLHHELAAVSYKPTITLMLHLDREPSGFPDHGGAQYNDHPTLAFVTDNRRKGITGEQAVTVHLSNELSAELWDASDDALLIRALDLVAHHLDGAGVTDCTVRRWRYAGPVEAHPERTVVWGTDPLIALSGEAFGGPKVEGAFLSGLAAAEAIHSALG